MHGERDAFRTTSTPPTVSPTGVTFGWARFGLGRNEEPPVKKRLILESRSFPLTRRADAGGPPRGTSPPRAWTSHLGPTETVDP